jgi:hypothetical protein
MDVDITAGFIKNKAGFSIRDDNKYQSRRSWTAEEDMKLLKLASENNAKNWKKIAIILGTKTGPQCSYRYNKLNNDGMRSKWHRSEDIQLLELVETYGKNWHMIAMNMTGRTGEEARHRYVMKLDPRFKRSRFDRDEDDLILRLHDKYGNDWNEISRHFPRRNVIMVKNRYYSHLKNRNKDSTTVNITGSETLSNYSSSLTPSLGNGNFHFSFNGRNSISYNEKGFGIWKGKLFDDDYFINDRNGFDNAFNPIPIFDNDDYSDLRAMIPQDLYKSEEVSPRSLESEDRFNQEYNNVFNYPIKKNSFGEDLMDTDTKEDDAVKAQDETTQNENDNLMKQYQLLESVFMKIYEVSNHSTLKGSF